MSDTAPVSAVLLDDRPAPAAVEIDLATGPGCGLAGVRRLIAALVAAGADVGDVPDRYPVEWARLTDPGPGNAAALADLALSASERRLHRESEQTFRVLAVAASAVCRASDDLGVSLLLRGVGRTDLPSLRGLVRAVEFSAATGTGRLQLAPSDAVLVPRAADPATDTRDERARCLRAMGLPVTVGDLRPVPLPEPGPAAGADDGTERVLFATATDQDTPPPERIAAALAYGRAAFYASNWEGLGLVAASCLPLAAGLTPGDLDDIVAQHEDRHADHGGGPRADQAIEFESALLRRPGDVTAYLLKLLGIQASYRGRHDEALRFFRDMRAVDGPVSVELRAQSHLYCALTLAKRQNLLTLAADELDAGFTVVAARAGEAAPVRRERGWLHNLRGLVLFRQKEYVAALEQERAALECVEGMADASSVHLRVNLISNISVLQESAGKVDQALNTWERFRTVSADTDEKFVKHHAYRTGGLRMAAGDIDGGVPELARSLEYSVRAHDDFHEFEISAELGALMLGRDRSSAAGDYFEQASRAATRLGDPYRMAVASVGQAAAAKGPIGESTASLALASRTQPDRAEALVAGCQDGTDVRILLPWPRTKLNRPFDLINV